MQTVILQYFVSILWWQLDIDKGSLQY